MKVLKFIGVFLLLVIGIVLIAGAFMKKDFKFEREVAINAPKAVVWNNVVMLKNHDKWSQWKEMDPNMTNEITGTDGQVGAKVSWKSTNKSVGNGSQTISNIVPGERVDTDLDFGGNGKAKAYFLVSGDSTSSKIKWGFESHVGWPMNFIARMMMTEKNMGGMLDKGLGMLKNVSESEK